MPIYEYDCKSCGKRIDVLQKMSDPAPATCASCGAEGTMERTVSRTSFVLKGGGWYKDLYASSNSSSSGSSSSSGASSGDSGSSSSASSSSSTSTSTGRGSTASSTSGGGASTSSSTPAASGTKS